MSRFRNHVVIAVALLAAYGVMLLPGQQAAAGPYTAAQATAGRTVYQANCASCHLPNLQGSGDAPPLAGSGFLSSWGDRTARELVAFIQTTMPPGGAGRLSETDYVSVAAMILESNGGRAGNQSLTAA